MKRQTHSQRRQSVVVGLLLSLVLSGCHMHQQVAIPGATQTLPAGAESVPVERGDHLRATLVNGTAVNFTVAEVRSDALVATDGQRILYRDIARLDQKRLAKGRTVALIAGLAAAGYLVLVLAASAAGPVIY